MQRIGGRRRSERIGSCNGGLVIEFNTGSNRSVNKSTENSWFLFFPPPARHCQGFDGTTSGQQVQAWAQNRKRVIRRDLPR